MLADLVAIEHLAQINTLPKEVCAYVPPRYCAASRQLPV